MADQKKQFIIKAKGMYGAGECTRSACCLEVRNGMIHAISDDMSGLSGDDIIDFGTLMISPCFCDYHLHFSERAAGAAGSIGAALLRYGIAHAYEGGDKGLTGLSVKKTLNGRPAILTSGYALYQRGGYGSALGRGVNSFADAVDVIKELLSFQVDYIKIIHSGVYQPEAGQISAGGFDATVLRSIVQYARERRLAVFCHANGEKAVREAVDAGVSVVIHGLYTCDETFAQMAEGNVAFIPTVHAFQSLLALAKTDAARHTIGEMVDAHLSAVNRAFEYKVRVLPGSDSGPKFIPYGSSYMNELELFLRAGIPIEDVIRSAAAAMLTEGSSADFVLLDGTSVKHVVFRGQFLL